MYLVLSSVPTDITTTRASLLLLLPFLCFSDSVAYHIAYDAAGGIPHPILVALFLYPWVETLLYSDIILLMRGREGPLPPHHCLGDTL